MIWNKIADFLKNFWPAYIILPILLFFRDNIKNWFMRRFTKGAEKLEEEKFDQHAAKYEQKWTKELQLAKKISADRDVLLESKMNEAIYRLEDKLETEKQADETFQTDVADAFRTMNEKLDLIQNTQNNNCNNMGAKLAEFQAQVSNDMIGITKGLLSVQQSDLERNCLEYKHKGSMTTKEKRDFEKRWKMYKEMGGDDLEWVKDTIAIIPVTDY